MNPVIAKLHEAQMRKDLPEFRPGDTVRVNVRLKEGEGEKEKERLQALFFLLALAFLQADVDAHRVAGAKFGKVFAHLRFMEFGYNRIHVRIPCRPTQAGPALQRQTLIIAKYSQFT